MNLMKTASMLCVAGGKRGDIRNLMDKEREAERTKNELITNVAHDLRTPLTSIIGYLELLSGKVEIPAEMQKKYIPVHEYRCVKN